MRKCRTGFAAVLVFSISLRFAFAEDKLLNDAFFAKDTRKILELLEQSKEIDPAVTFFGSTALMEAAQIGDMEVLGYLIRKGADVNKKDSRGDTALMYAAGGGSLEAVSLLIERGADLKAKSKTGKSALSLAALRYTVEDAEKDDVIELLVKKGADLNVQDDEGMTPLMNAAMIRNVPAVRSLVRCGADVKLRDKDLCTPLIIAESMLEDFPPDYDEGYSQRAKTIAKILVESGVNINAANLSGETALSRAEALGYDEIRELLLQKGAGKNVEEPVMDLLAENYQGPLKGDEDVNKKNNLGVTALMEACQMGNLELVRKLIEKGADIDLRDNNKNSALIHALGYGGMYEGQKDNSSAEEIALLLMEKGADILTPDYEGTTPFQYAWRNGRKKVVQALIEKGALKDKKERNTVFLSCAWAGDSAMMRFLFEQGVDLGYKGQFERTALMHAAHEGQSDIIRMLSGWGSALNDRDSIGETALFKAASFGRPAAVKTLLEIGADPAIPDNKGQTPYAIARSLGHGEIVKLFEESGVKK